jgi:putative ABC transport system permease protein
MLHRLAVRSLVHLLGALLIVGETAEENGLQIGDTVTIDLGDEGASEYEIIGTYRIVYGGGFVAEVIYVPLPSIAGPERATQLLVRGDAGSLDEGAQLSKRIEEGLSAGGVASNPYVTAAVLEERQFANNQFAALTVTLLSLAFIVAGVGSIGLSGALGISAVERTREIGVMRTIDGSHRRITGLFVMEGLLQALASWLLAIPLSYILARPLSRLMGQAIINLDLDSAFSWLAVGIWLAIILVIALIASLAPARRAARTSVRESLTYA